MTKVLKMPAMVAAAAAASVVATARLACACAMCGAPPGGGARGAYDLSVLLTLAAPYLTVAAMGGMLFVAWRRSRRDEHPGAASMPPARSQPASIPGAPGAPGSEPSRLRP